MPTSIPLQPTVTAAGLAAIFNAQSTGVEFELSHIAFGTAQYVPDGSETALRVEKVRVPIAGGGRISPTQIQIYAIALAAAGNPFFVGEVGFFGDDGATLLAVYSSTATPSLFLSDTVATSVSYALGLAALPANSVTVTIDPSASAALLLIGNHVTAPDPHPQYVEKVNGVAFYDPTLTFNDDALVVGDDGLLYQSLQASNIGHLPSASPTWWGPVQAVGLQAAGKLNGVNSPNTTFNGSGEFGSVGWSSLGQFVPEVDTTGNLGSFFTNTSPISAASVFPQGPQSPCGANQTVSASIDVGSLGVTDGTVSLTIACFTSSGSFISNIGGAIIPNGTGMARYSTTGTTPTGTAFISGEISCVSVTAAIAGIVFRRLKIESGGTPSLYSQEASIAALGQQSPLIGTATNLKCVTLAAGTALPYSADQIIVGASLGGQTFCISNFSANISALDTGALAANSFYAAYAYLKSDGTTGGFLQLEPAGGAPRVYGGTHPPANMIASSLIGVWLTNASKQFIAATQIDRDIAIPPVTALSTSTTQASPTALSIASAIPMSARKFSGTISVASTSTTPNTSLILYASSAAVGAQGINTSVGAAGGNSCTFNGMPASTAQTAYYTATSSSGTPTFTLAISGYEI